MQVRINMMCMVFILRRGYSANKAQHKTYVRRLYAKRNLKKIRCNDELENYIRKKMMDD